MLPQSPLEPKLKPHFKAAYLPPPVWSSLWLWFGLMLIAAGGGYASRQIKEQGLSQFRADTNRFIYKVWNQATYRLMSAKTPFQQERQYVDLVAVSRTPVVQTATNHYAFLGLGQDPMTAKQVVWIRNLRTNQIDRFSEGELVFKDRLRIYAIKRHGVEVSYGNKMQHILLLP